MRVEHQAALANKDEDGLWNYEFSKIECGVEHIVSGMIDRVVQWYIKYPTLIEKES